MRVSKKSACPKTDYDADRTGWRKYESNPTPELLKTLLDRSVPLVRRVARSMAPRLSKQVELDELVSSGAFGLIDAASRYSPGRETDFATFAGKRIRGAILDELRQQDWMPRSIRTSIRALEAAEDTLAASLGRNPTERELCDTLDVTPQELGRIGVARAQRHVGSLEESQTDEEDGPSLLDTLRDTNGSRDPERAAHRLLVRRAIARVVGQLTLKEQLVLQLKYREELTCREIAAVLGVSDSRVSQLHTRALERLREKLASQEHELCDSE